MGTCPVCQGQFSDAAFCPRDGTRLEIAADADAGLLLGGRYKLIRKVGAGAMGTVFEAEHVSIRRRVSVKILHRNLVTSPEMVERLRREAQVTSGLGHPNIVDCLDFGTEDGQVYLVMEWLEGENLDTRLDRGPVPVELALEIAVQTCAGLAVAHAGGVIHRDLKPANLFLTENRLGSPWIKILDFGIAKLLAEHTQLTSTGVLIGTPNYMAPEQARGEPVDARTDVYALGVILYELIVGLVPFRGDTPLSVLHQHTTKMPALPSAAATERAISAELDTLVMTCLAKAPADRFQRVEDVAAAVEAIRATRSNAPTPAHSPTPTPTPANSLIASVSDDDDLDEPVHRPRRPRGIALVLGCIALAAAGIAVVATLQRDDTMMPVLLDAAFVPASLVDAHTTDAAVIVDAVGPDAAPRGVLVNRSVTNGLSIETWMTPEQPEPDQAVSFAITVSRVGAAGRDALPNALRVKVEHFAKHDVLALEVVNVEPDARGMVRWTARRGKHHILVEPMVGQHALGRVRFDIEVP